MAGRRRWNTARETADRRGEQFLTLYAALSHWVESLSCLCSSSSHPGSQRASGSQTFTSCLSAGGSAVSIL